VQAEFEVSVANLSKELGLLLQEVHRVWKNQHFESCWRSSARSVQKSLKESELTSSGGIVPS
jgi:hypothetical protein